MQAGYHVYIARLNAKCRVPHNRDRVFVVLTLFPRAGALERHLEFYALEPVVRLADWFPDLGLVRARPCRSAPAVFDAARRPHPSMRTCCCLDLKPGYVRRPGDAGDVSDSVFLPLERRKLLCGLPSTFVLPPISERCRLSCCEDQRMGFPLLSVCLGNIVVSQQALEVLAHLDVPDDLLQCHWSRGTSSSVAAEDATATLSREATWGVPSASAAVVSRAGSARQRLVRSTCELGPPAQSGPPCSFELVGSASRDSGDAFGCGPIVESPSS